MKTIGIVGNPNCGKTTIFNALTGSNQHIGNWPASVAMFAGFWAYGHRHRIDMPRRLNVV